MNAPPGQRPRAVRAAALAYHASDAQAGRSPRLVAKGQGQIAEQIIERARVHGVPVHQSAELVAALMPFDLDQHIPPALYVAVAEVLSWVYRLEHRLPPAVPPAAGATSELAR